MGNCISGNANGNINAAASSASSGGGSSGSLPAATLKSPHNTAGLSSSGAAKPASSSNGALELRGDPLAAAPTRNSVIRAPALSQGELRKLKAKRLAVAAEALAEGTQIAKVEKSPAQFQLIAKAVSGNPLFTSLQNEARTVIIMSMFPQDVPKLKSIEDTSCFDDYDINEEHPGESFKPGRKLSNGVFDSF